MFGRSGRAAVEPQQTIVMDLVLPTDATNADFEDLINLLGTDGSSHPDSSPRPIPTPATCPPQVTLRHPDGRFDFSQIRHYFSTPNYASTPSQEDVEPEEPRDNLIDEGNCSSSRTEIYAGVFLSAKVSQMVTIPRTDNTSQGLRSPNNILASPFDTEIYQPSTLTPVEAEEPFSTAQLRSISPLTLPPTTGQVVHPSHSQTEPLIPVPARSSSTSPFLQTYMPSPPVFMDPTHLRRGLSSSHGSHSSENQLEIDFPSILDQNDMLEALKQSLVENKKQSDALNHALRLAKAEASDLRQRCEDLKSLVGELQSVSLNRGTVVEQDEIVSSHNTASQRPRSSSPGHLRVPIISTAATRKSPRMEGSTKETIDAARQELSAPMDEIDLMSGEEARRSLKAILACLSLPMKPQMIPDIRRDRTTSPTNLNDILHTMEFVQMVDSLVWRKSEKSQADANGKTNVFREENLKALEDRIKLWERVVRNPIRRTK